MPRYQYILNIYHYWFDYNYHHRDHHCPKMIMCGGSVPRYQHILNIYHHYHHYWFDYNYHDGLYHCPKMVMRGGSLPRYQHILNIYLWLVYNLISRSWPQIQTGVLWAPTLALRAGLPDLWLLAFGLSGYHHD